MEETKKETNPFDLMMNEVSKLVEAKTKPLHDKISKMQSELDMLRKPVVMPDAKEYYNSEEVCELIGIHHNTLYRLRQKGEIECIRIGQYYRYSKDSVKKYIQSLEFKRPEIAPSLKLGHKASRGGEAQNAPSRTSYRPRNTKKNIA